MNGNEKMSGSDCLYFSNEKGREVRGNLCRVTPLSVSFEVYANDDVPVVSEAFEDCRIIVGGELAYEGRAVIGSIVDVGAAFVCEAQLAEGLRNLHTGPADSSAGFDTAAFDRFVRSSQSLFQLSPSFKLVIADMKAFLMDFQRWTDQYTVSHTAHLDDAERAKVECDVVHHLQDSFKSFFAVMFERFEEACDQAEKQVQPALSSYIQRNLHPWVLCSPFMRRTFEKPLGYAGDYEMVNMMLRDPVEGDTLYAKALNTFFLNTPPVVAHRNRILRLKTVLFQEACRVKRDARPLRVLNVGCGPAKELQDFIAEEAISDGAEFTLVDFNQETLQWTKAKLEGIMAQHGRKCSIQLLRTSVTQLFKEGSRSGKTGSTGSYDLVYCAGLFDYLTDAVCARLVQFFFRTVSVGGLVLVTNVESSNPSRKWMEYAVDWHLVYRDRAMLEALVPVEASSCDTYIAAEMSGVNVFLEIRKDSHD